MLKSKSYFFIFFLIIGGQALYCQPKQEDFQRLSLSFIKAIKDTQFFGDKGYFENSFYGKMIASQAEKKARDFLDQVGPIVAFEKNELDTQGCKLVTATSVITNGGKFLWYLHFDQDQHIQRFDIDTFRTHCFYRPEAMLRPFSYREITVESNPLIKLPGTLFLPQGKGKRPLVVIVHGSGPHDRNGSMLRNKIYRDMALQLVQKDIAVLLYDKRTYVYQFKDPFPIDSMDYFSETVEDAVAAFYLGKSLQGVDSNRIYIAGHSQGALCGPLIAKRCKGLRGMILLAAPARSLLEIIPEQLDYISSLNDKQTEEAQKQVNAIKWQVANALKPDLSLNSRLMLPFGAKAKYWLLDRNYKVLDEAGRLNIPLILFQGGRDYNVTRKDFDLWTKAMEGKNNFRAQWLEHLDHLFFEGVGRAKPEDLQQEKHVSKILTNQMAEFINSN